LDLSQIKIFVKYALDLKKAMYEAREFYCVPAKKPEVVPAIMRRNSTKPSLF